VPETVVFHPKFGANTINNFDLAGDSINPLAHDFLRFDKGMFFPDTAAAGAAAHETKNGDVVIDVHACPRDRRSRMHQTA
jgi:hypothetical protein